MEMESLGYWVGIICRISKKASLNVRDYDYGLYSQALDLNLAPKKSFGRCWIFIKKNSSLWRFRHLVFH